MKTIEEKKTTAKKASKTAETKPAVKSAVKTAAKTSAPKKTTTKTAAKKTTATKTTVNSASTAAAKKTGRKPKPVTIDTICGLMEKKIGKSKASAINETIAVDIEVWGFEDGSNHKMYIEVKDGKVSVMPHSYDAKDFRVSLSFANAVDFANGKITLAKLIEDKDFYAEGNIVSAVKLAKIFG